jgi:hypothetical protein
VELLESGFDKVGYERNGSIIEFFFWDVTFDSCDFIKLVTCLIPLSIIYIKIQGRN